MVHDDEGATGPRLEQIVQRVAAATHNQPLAQAVQTLKTELTGAGFAVDSPWCRKVLEKVRRGELVVLDLP